MFEWIFRRFNQEKLVNSILQLEEEVNKLKLEWENFKFDVIDTTTHNMMRLNQRMAKRENHFEEEKNKTYLKKDDFKRNELLGVDTSTPNNSTSKKRFGGGSSG